MNSSGVSDAAGREGALNEQIAFGGVDDVGVP